MRGLAAVLLLGLLGGFAASCGTASSAPSQPAGDDGGLSPTNGSHDGASGAPASTEAGPGTEASTNGGSDGQAPLDGGAATDASVQVTSGADAGSADAATNDGPAGDAAFACGDKTCPDGQVCIVDQFSSGGCAGRDDAGLCGGGMTPAVGPNCCGYAGPCCRFGVTSTSYRCGARPSACGATLTCTCASSLCSGGSCQSASADQLECASGP
jgi:hypothetical protein